MIWTKEMVGMMLDKFEQIVKVSYTRALYISDINGQDPSFETEGKKNLNASGWSRLQKVGTRCKAQ